MRSIWLSIALLLALPAAAHEGLSDQIHNTTHWIARQPRNAELYLRRGELHRLNEEWKEAERDYKKAAQLDPSLDAVHLARGTMLLESGHPASAVPSLQRYLEAHPGDPRGRITYGRTLAKLDRALEAAAELDAALALSPAPDPDIVIERVHALLAAGRPHEALTTLDEAMAHLGPIASLQLEAIELELRTCNAEGALRRIAAAEKSAPRKETWLARRGDILRDLAREDEARTAYQQALDALAELPPERRLTRAMRELEAKLRKGLQAP